MSVLDLRSADAVTRFLPRHVVDGRGDAAGRLLSACLTVDAAVAGLGAGVVLVVAAAVPRLAPLSPLAVALVLLGAASTLPSLTARAVLNVHGRHGLVAAVQTAGNVLRLAAVAAVVLADAGLLAVLIAFNVGLLLEAVITLLLAARTALDRGATRSGLRLCGPRGIPAEVRGFIGWNGAATISGGLVKHGDVVLVGAMAGPTAAGLYRLAKSLALPIGTLATPLQTIFYNRLSARRARGAVAWRPTLVRAQLVVLPVVLLLVAAAPLAPVFVRLLAGEEFAAAGPAAIWLVLGGALGLATYWGRPVLLALDALKPNLYVGAGVSFAFAAVAVPAASVAGAEGAALARLAVVSVIGNALLLVIVSRAVAADARRDDRGDEPERATGPRPYADGHLTAGDGKTGT